MPFWFAVRLDTIVTLTMTAIALICVLERNNADTVLLCLLLTYTLTVQANTVASIRTAMTLEARMVNAERVMSILNIPQEYIDGEEPPEWPSQGQIEFKDVVLRHTPYSRIALEHLSFKVNPGEKICIVGRSGAGKSTIGLSLSRIVEIELNKGQIMIDNIDIRTVNINYLRSQITVIP